MLAGVLAQLAAGAGAYLFWNQTLYAELSLYQTANRLAQVGNRGRR